MKKNIQQWWQNRYNDKAYFYLVSHMQQSSDNQTKKEVDIVFSIIKKNFQNTSSLDLLDVGGGYGRHAFYFSKFGLNSVSVLDQSEIFILIGNFVKNFQNTNKINFYQGDARNLSGTVNQKFDIVTCLGNSILGYFDDPNDDILFINQIFASLKTNGLFILDIQDADFIKNYFSTEKTEQIISSVYTVTTKRYSDENYIYIQETIKKNGALLSNDSFKIKLYYYKNIQKIAFNTGFTHFTNGHQIDIESNYGTMAHRSIFVMKKGI
jgi:SAM-dependent methyltransferase